MPWPVYAPRMAARLFVPTLGVPSARIAQNQSDQVFQLDVRPIKARWLSNPYNEADELYLTCVYDEAGIDPRYLKSAEVYFWLADSDPSLPFTPTSDTQRFVGIVRDVGRELTQETKWVTFKVQDYTCLFLEMKHYPASQLPRFTDTLTTAWQRVCDNTGYYDLDTRKIQSSVSNLRDRIVFQGGVDPNTSLGASVPQRIRQLGHMQAQTGTDAWAVWRTVCESLGLITFIRGDQCVVTTATDYFTASDPPLFVYGLNIYELRENRDLAQVSGKNVCVRSYDPIAGTSLESLFPPPTDALAVRRKKLGASAKKAPKSVQTQEYEVMDLPFAVSDQPTLDTIAERVWHERTRQEMRGELVTREMTIGTVGEIDVTAFDLLKLQAGDQIQIQIAREALDAIQALPTQAARIDALESRGYSSQVAEFVAQNLDSINSLPAQFLVHSVEVSLDIPSGTAEGSYNCRIEFLNRVDISQSGTVPLQSPNAPRITGTNIPPLSGQTPAYVDPFTP
jgi:hypothetical protein